MGFLLTVIAASLLAVLSGAVNQTFTEFFIIGGTPATPGRYPYAVNLYRSQSSSRPFCGGTLIAPNIVLSAAHCEGVDKVGVGCWDISANEDCDEITVTQELLHPNYRQPFGGGITNDFMILVLAQNSRFAPISFVADETYGSQFSSGFAVTAMGWGTTVQGSNAFSDVLLEVEVGYVSQNDCDNAYSGRIDDTMMCAASPGKDSCQGDSGGPLIAKCDTTGNDVLVGIVSWGYGCASPSYPGVYARVSSGWPWVESTLSNLGVLGQISSPVPSLSSYCSSNTPFPTAFPTPFPTTPTVPPTSTCFDQVPSGLIYSNTGAPAPCDELFQYCRFYDIVRERCPATCGICTTSLAIRSDNVDSSEVVALEELMLSQDQGVPVAAFGGAVLAPFILAAAFFTTYKVMSNRADKKLARMNTAARATNPMLADAEVA